MDIPGEHACQEVLCHIVGMPDFSYRMDHLRGHFLQDHVMKNTVRVERAKKQITQAELADALDVSRLTIHSIETGKFNPSVQLALKMAQYFQVTVEDLFSLEE